MCDFVNCDTQVVRMLPGGFDVVGVFLVASPETMEQYQGQLRNLLYKIRRVCQTCYQLGKELEPDKMEPDERILLQISSTTRKYSCIVFFNISPIASLCLQTDTHAGFLTFLTARYDLCS